MNTLAQTEPAHAPRKSPSVKVFGVGSTGANVMELMITDCVAGVGFVALNTDPKPLAPS